MFFAVASALSLTVLSADATNAYANSPPPDVPTFVWVDDAYINWYRTKFGVTLNKGMVMPVLHALQGHPKSGALWEAHINGILKEEGFRATVQERNFYRATIEKQTVLLCRQVDDIAIASSEWELASRVIDRISQKVDMVKEGVMKKFNGVDIDQRKGYTKIHATSYLTKMLQAHGWATPEAKEPTRLLEPMAPDSDQLGQLRGPLEHTPVFK